MPSLVSLASHSHVDSALYLHRDFRILSCLRCRRRLNCIRSREGTPSEERELAGSVYVHMAGTHREMLIRV